MKRRKSISTKLQPLTPEAMVHIADLAAEHSVGIEQRCARYRRRASIRRTVVAACFLAILGIGADTAYAKQPLYTGINTCGHTDNTYIYNTISTILNQL